MFKLKRQQPIPLVSQLKRVDGLTHDNGETVILFLFLKIREKEKERKKRTVLHSNFVLSYHVIIGKIKPTRNLMLLSAHRTGKYSSGKRTSYNIVRKSNISYVPCPPKQYPDED